MLPEYSFNKANVIYISLNKRFLKSLKDLIKNLPKKKYTYLFWKIFFQNEETYYWPEVLVGGKREIVEERVTIEMVYKRDI